MPVATQFINKLSNQSHETKSNLLNKPIIQRISNRILQQSHPDKVDRCIHLLEHSGNCQDLRCKEGEGCVRTKKVLFHYLNCPKTKAEEKCSICHQLLALCNLHAQRCQEHAKGCYVPHCHNKKQPDTPPKLEAKNMTSEEYKRWVMKMVKALRLSPTEEKRQRLVQMLITDQRTGIKLLRELYKMKRSSAELNQVVPTNQQIIGQTCGQEAMVPNAINNQGNHFNHQINSSPISFSAKSIARRV